MTGNSGIGMEERIRARAYQLWVEEGRPHGREHEHWERAKRLIEEDERESKSSKAPASPAPAPADTLTAVIDPPYKTKTAVKKKRSFKSAKA